MIGATSSRERSSALITSLLSARSAVVVVNTTDGPDLATAGTGDVLTGIVGALLAQGVEPAAAAATAAYVHGRAAHVAGTAPGLVASDVIDALPRTLAALANRP